MARTPKSRSLGSGGGKITSLRFRGRPSSERDLKGLRIKKDDPSDSIITRVKSIRNKQRGN